MTIQDLVQQLNNSSLSMFPILKGNFLDEYFSSAPEEKVLMLLGEPEAYPDIPIWIYAFLAGMVHKLSNDFSLVVPDWIFKDMYYLDEPYFSENVTNDHLKIYLMYTSPSEFKHRNIFTSEDTLKRV